ncbi:MAG: DUF1992 domain-containing protein [Deltaproteobacteria bacterium]|nr:DUF1992 domain-containing protein [Deltaproteobacteria bacterium]
MEERIDVIALVAERKILEAIAEGQFDNLSGAGKPLPDDDLANLPPDIRLAYRILRNSGFADADEKNENCGRFEDLFGSAAEESRMYKNLTNLKLKLDKSRKEPKSKKISVNDPLTQTDENGLFESPYLEKIIAKLFG